MGGSLGPVNQLIENNIVKFYIRYVDDTLLVLREKEIDIFLNKFNSFSKNVRILTGKKHPKIKLQR